MEVVVVLAVALLFPIIPCRKQIKNSQNVRDGTHATKALSMKGVWLWVDRIQAIRSLQPILRCTKVGAFTEATQAKFTRMKLWSEDKHL